MERRGSSGGVSRSQNAQASGTCQKWQVIGRLSDRVMRTRRGGEEERRGNGERPFEAIGRTSSPPGRVVLAKRLQVLWQVMASPHVTAGMWTPFTSVASTSVRGKSSDASEMDVSRKSGPARSRRLPQ